MREEQYRKVHRPPAIAAKVEIDYLHGSIFNEKIPCVKITMDQAILARRSRAFAQLVQERLHGFDNKWIECFWKRIGNLHMCALVPGRTVLIGWQMQRIRHTVDSANLAAKR